MPEPTIEEIDDHTNIIMDNIRRITKLDTNSDKDDELYTIIHNYLKSLLLTPKS